MPRWRALPDELDPQVREFAEQLRRLVERSGLSIAAVADRTGYSKTSWERYLNGRLLPPRGAAEALAEATGTDVGHLGTLWELAERAWSRSELRHDVTMEAIRVAEARAALAGFGPQPANGGAAAPRTAALHGEGLGEGPDGTDLGLPRTPGAADVRDKAIPLRKQRKPKRSGKPAQETEPSEPQAPAPPGRFGPPAAAPPPTRRRNAVLFAVGAVGALFVVAAVVLLVGAGGEDRTAPGAAATPSVSKAPSLPSGVRCTGADCAGKDPESMGCGGRHATTAGSVTVGAAYLEVRYSEVCGAAWARITQAGPGDTLRITSAGSAGGTESGRVDRGADGHTRMVAVSDSRQASACAALVSGRTGCTKRSAPQSALGPLG
ncbi:DUF2690 domain-containing protein [Streptomyces sp. NPDC049585]|uniref:helix-turn-helix domain-containing protein n=1 Tax=Streptomyces sp. NPDC049585 TaxID=3155154 RepID=UPI003416DEB1